MATQKARYWYYRGVGWNSLPVDVISETSKSYRVVANWNLWRGRRITEAGTPFWVRKGDPDCRIELDQ